MIEPKFTIRTETQAKDYRQFLYIATFRRKVTTIPMVLGLCIIGGVGATWFDGSFSVSKATWVTFVMIMFSIAAIFYVVEKKNKENIAMLKQGEIPANIFHFYDDKLTLTLEGEEESGKRKYDAIYNVMESKKYFVLCLTETMATLIRKQDMNPEEIDEFKAFMKLKLQKRYRKI